MGISEPLRFFRCQVYEHTSLSCRSKRKCATCGELYHKEFSHPQRCVNCGGAHTAYDKQCPTWFTKKGHHEGKSSRSKYVIGLKDMQQTDQLTHKDKDSPFFNQSSQF